VGWSEAERGENRQSKEKRERKDRRKKINFKGSIREKSRQKYKT
jgi:hypothetical protein